MPALPLHEAGKYVAAAYIVVFALVLIYVAIMAARLGRIERELGELLELSERGAPPSAGEPAMSAPTTGTGTAAPSAGGAGTADGAQDPLDVGRPQSTHV
jgi:CcmD family protein